MHSTQQPRRSALGRVSSSRLNAQLGSQAPPHPKTRMSMGPGTTLPRYSLGGAGLGATNSKKAAKQQRMSMMPAMGGGASAMSSNTAATSNNTARRQSTVSLASRRKSTATLGGGAMSSAGGLKSDPRPLADKGFRAQCIETLIQFLSDHNYDQALSPKILHRPTGKDFEHLALFLFRLVDPHRRFDGKFPDEVTLMYKGLRYPFNISKTSLAAVGSPHTWPALLASLVWVVELLSYDEQAGLSLEDANDDDDGAQDMDRAFLAYLRHAYRSFLSGDDARYASLDDALTGKFRARDAAIERDAAQAEATRAALERQLAEEQATPSLLPELEQRKRHFQGDKLQCDRLVGQCEENKRVMLGKVREREQEAAAKTEELRAAERQRAGVQRQLDEQELKPADAERMNQERRALHEAAERVLEEREALQTQLRDAEAAQAARGEAVRELLASYNGIAAALKLVRSEHNGSDNSSSDKSGSPDVHVILDADACALACVAQLPASGAAHHASGDTGKLRAALADLRDLSAQRTQQIRTAAMEVQAEAERNEETQAAAAAEVRAAEARLAEAEARFASDKACMESELAARAAEADAVEEAIHRLTAEADRARAPLQEAGENAEALRAALGEAAARHDAAVCAADEDLHSAIGAFCAYKEEAGAQLSGLRAQLEERLARASAASAQLQ